MSLNNKFEIMGSKANTSFWNSKIFAVFLIVFSTILVSFAQVNFKMSWNDAVISFSLLKSVLLGLGMYVIGSLLFMAVLRKRNVTFVFPFMALSYVWVIFLSAYLFGEKITLFKSLGVALIFTGVFLIYIGGKDNGDNALKARKVKLC